MESSTVDFHQDFQISVIQKLAFHIPHVFIIEKNHCGNMCQEAFTSCSDFQDVLCRCDYAERVVASFAHQIRSEYYGGNISVSIEGVSLEQFSAKD